MSKWWGLRTLLILTTAKITSGSSPLFMAGVQIPIKLVRVSRSPAISPIVPMPILNG